MIQIGDITIDVSDPAVIAGAVAAIVRFAAADPV
jgi:hypothetical protein